MSDIYFVNYSSGSFIKNRRWNNLFIRLFVRPKALLSLTDEDLKNSDVYSANRAVLDSPRGGGYWAWKPWAILKAFELAGSGDIVIYQDSGKGLRYKNFIKPKRLISAASRYGQIAGVSIPERGKNEYWTKKHCFEKMDCDSVLYKETPQIEATTSIWVVNDRNRKVIEEWQQYCLDLEIVSDTEDISGECAGFIEHRHDQSILTNLVVKYDLNYLEQMENHENLFKSISVQELFSRRGDWLYGWLWSVLVSFKRMRK